MKSIFFYFSCNSLHFTVWRTNGDYCHCHLAPLTVAATMLKIWKSLGTFEMNMERIIFRSLVQYSSTRKIWLPLTTHLFLAVFFFFGKYNSVDEHLFKTRVKFGYLLESAYFLQLFHCGLLGFQHHLLYRTIFSVAFFLLARSRQIYRTHARQTLTMGHRKYDIFACITKMWLLAMPTKQIVK